jgi:hypothetical protein
MSDRSLLVALAILSGISFVCSTPAAGVTVGLVIGGRIGANDPLCLNLTLHCTTLSSHSHGRIRMAHYTYPC